MERSCVNCGIKGTCLKRSLGIVLLYIQTGRSTERYLPYVREVAVAIYDAGYRKVASQKE